MNPDGNILQECDCCHDEFPLRQVALSESGQLLCVLCASAANPNLLPTVTADELLLQHAHKINSDSPLLTENPDATKPAQPGTTRPQKDETTASRI